MCLSPDDRLMVKKCLRKISELLEKFAEESYGLDGEREDYDYIEEIRNLDSMIEDAL